MSVQDIYEEHHREHREQGFSILKDDRGAFFAKAIGTGKSVLDIGCRDGALTQFFIKGNEVVGADIDTESLARAELLGISTVMVDLLGDWHELGGRKFDVIVAGEVLEHLYYPHEVARKVALHLKPGGYFIGSVPNAFSLKNRLRYLSGTTRHTPLEDPTHINQFSAAALKKTLRSEFGSVTVSGLGKHAFLAEKNPNLFAFDLAFVARA